MLQICNVTHIRAFIVIIIKLRSKIQTNNFIINLLYFQVDDSDPKKVCRV